MDDSTVTNIVSKDFWEDDYLSGTELPSRPDRKLAIDRSIAAALSAHADVERGASVVEIGCAPASWLLFYAERFGAVVTGIEYTERGVALSRANLEAAGVPGTIAHADFFDVTAQPHDLVLSLGFIEHFDDLDATFARHLDFLAPGGRLAVGVPNYRGLNRVLQSMSDPAHLRLHNLEAMRPALYRRLAAEHGLEVEYQDHIGGFDPIIIKIGRRAVLPLILLEGRYRRLRVADRINHPLASSYLLTVLRRPPASA